MSFYIKSILLLLLTAFLIIEPEASIGAAQKGLTLWWQMVVPALLPFFIISELLIRLQVIHYIGKWLNSFMHPLFKLPGTAGLAIAMGYTSGFPVGAIVSSHLYQENLLNRQQASHLIAFTNNSSPLFIIGTIGVGMLSNQYYGYILAIAHYGSNLLVGWFLGRKNRAPGPEVLNISAKSSPPGNLLGHSIRNSINNICQIGGYIIFFMVLTAFLRQIGLFDGLMYLLGQWFPMLPPSLIYGSLIGLLEITQGAQAIGAAQAPILWKLMVLTILLCFSGLCIQAQIHSIVSDTKLSFRPYLQARLLQIPPALLFTWIGWLLIGPIPAITGSHTSTFSYYWGQGYWQWFALLLVMLILSGAVNVATYVFAGLVPRVQRGLTPIPRSKPFPYKLTSHQHIGWHHLQFPRLRFWPWR